MLTLDSVICMTFSFIAACVLLFILQYIHAQKIKQLYIPWGFVALQAENFDIPAYCAKCFTVLVFYGLASKQAPISFNSPSVIFSLLFFLSKSHPVALNFSTSLYILLERIEEFENFLLNSHWYLFHLDFFNKHIQNINPFFDHVSHY